MVSKSELWSSHMAAWKSSGLSQAAYCRQHVLSLPSFGYWRGVLGRPPERPSSLALVPIRVGEPDTGAEVIEVRLANGLQVQLPVGLSAARWLPMVQALMTC
jgi:hypothetical protein